MVLVVGVKLSWLLQNTEMTFESVEEELAINT